MTAKKQNTDKLELLASPLQREVLALASEEAEWTRFSLAQAMNGLENEDSPEYSEADLKEKWQ